MTYTASSRRHDHHASVATLIDGMRSKNAYFPCRIGGAMRVSSLGGQLVIDSGLRSDTFNLVIGDATGFARAETVETIARGFNEARRPAAWWFVEGAGGAGIAGMLDANGFRYDETSIGMLAELDTLPTPVYPEDFVLRAASGREDIARFAGLIGALFVPPDPCVETFYARVAALGLDGSEPLKLYLGEVEGRAVCTAALYIDDDVAHVFDVSTASDQRRRGLASAAMHAALTLARERDGVRRAALQASPDGLGVYRRLGFGEVCRFHVHSNREAFSSI